MFRSVIRGIPDDAAIRARHHARMNMNTTTDKTGPEFVTVYTYRNYLPSVGPIDGRTFAEDLQAEFGSLVARKLSLFDEPTIVAITKAVHESPVSALAAITVAFVR